jgi:hypothetical protein
MCNGSFFDHKKKVGDDHFFFIFFTTLLLDPSVGSFIHTSSSLQTLMNLAVLFIFMLNTLPCLLSFRTSPTLPRHLSLCRLQTTAIKHKQPYFKQQLHRSPQPAAQRKMSQFSSSSFKVTAEEEKLFSTLRQVVKEEKLETTIR